MSLLQYFRAPAAEYGLNVLGEEGNFVFDLTFQLNILKKMNTKYRSVKNTLYL